VRIALITPAGSGSRAGNRHTATRWAAMLRAAGHRVALGTLWQADGATELMLALHARRSYPSIRAFRDAHPCKPLVVALTGTDLYRDIRSSAKARESLELANVLIALQPRAADELSARLRSKLQIVYQSCATRLRHAPIGRAVRFCVIGHLREEKDPLRALAALVRLPPSPAIELVQLGAPLDDALAAEARLGTERDARYRWLGSVPHARALRWLASSHAMVISSRMEGGANVVSEAIRIGVPVLASRIPGNVGLLGERYPGYFPVADDRALAGLLLRTATDARFRLRLEAHVSRLAPLVRPENESRLLRAAISAAQARGGSEKDRMTVLTGRSEESPQNC
jgi:putative glycosyltransferase (TIGR04348 family)